MTAPPHCERRVLWQLGPAFPIPMSMLHAGDEFEEGWLVVEAQWYKLEQLSPRGYRRAARFPSVCRMQVG